MTILYVALGGACGAALRFLFGRWAMRVSGAEFPWGTLGVNVIGSFVMGLAAVLLIERTEGGWARFAPFVMTGLLGGFTTFSAFSLDALYLMERGRMAGAAIYVAGSVALSVAALFAGLALARAAWGQG
ncbi:fluoride efflux transporter CrcB [uncultured Albimonas sp.]|uniref:fluoride efflux transporter CrcB n=1 Tax=uncultured Albimonas sp. TaxID=1331701 RepID=UPI0030EDF2E5